ncbi:hypothetical protein [Tardiphaga sp. P9-11]|uniref:hypothetical protein n=1 Tax=Tardiphaga sp. P9-11 TaxID=2024614 RepID=UPI0011F2D044|nr:hypothetical protein [Tardiphaga sp. P9-11]KAA0076108.1 hypothetical protein CIW50_07555 [Tardiphaga sp. P9-11]
MSPKWTPSIVPNGHDETVYLVVDCYGKGGCVYREADVGKTDLETIIADLMSGQYNDPDRVIAFNTANNWAQDVSDDIAREIRRRGDLAYEDLSSSIEDFVVRHAGRERQLALRLV